MSKLFELLQQASRQNMRPNAYLQSCQITFWNDGEIFIMVGGKCIAKVRDEAEAIAKLAAHLVEPLPASPEIDSRFDELEESFAVRKVLV